MCLSLLTESYPGRGIGPVIAYKKFKMIGDKIQNFCRPDNITWKIGREESAGPKTKMIENRWKHFAYPAGFHAYISKRAAYLGQNGVWAKVRLRGVQTRGKQSGKTVLVARYCKILEILGR